MLQLHAAERTIKYCTVHRQTDIWDRTDMPDRRLAGVGGSRAVDDTIAGTQISPSLFFELCMKSASTLAVFILLRFIKEISI